MSMQQVVVNLYRILSFGAPIALAVHTYKGVGDQQFFPTVTGLLSSPVCRLMMYNMGLYASYLLLCGAVRVFFGALRPLEMENTWERLYMTFIDGCLALTIFRAEMDRSILLLFVLLNVSKVFHWIAEMRVKLMETENASSRDISSVVAVSMTFCVLDSMAIASQLKYLSEHGVSVRILFLTEYMILFVSMLGIVARLFFYYWYRFTNTPWTNRGTSLFYLEIAVDLLQSLIYITFFAVTMINYGLPLHLIHDLFVTVSSVWKRINDVYNYRKLAANFDSRLPNATQEQLANADRCMICFETMTEAKVLHCNHMFHAACLRRWLETSLECPMCRSSVNLDEPPDAHPTQHQQQPHQPAPPAHTDVAPTQPTEHSSQTAPTTAASEGAEQTAVEDPQLVTELLDIQQNMATFYMQQMDMMQQMMQLQQQQQSQNVNNNTNEEKSATPSDGDMSTRQEESQVSEEDEKEFEEMASSESVERNGSVSAVVRQHDVTSPISESKRHHREVVQLRASNREMVRLLRRFVEKQRKLVDDFESELLGACR